MMPEMNDRISLAEFKKFIDQAYASFPDAKVATIGTAYRDGDLNYAIWLKHNGKEFIYRIPCYSD